jgi:hypothetical protein
VAALFGPGHVDVDKPLTPQKIDFKKTFTNSGNCKYLGEHHDH